MGIGPWHLLALIIIVLVFFGPSRLPTLGKSLGEAIRGFKKGLDTGEIDVTDSAKDSANSSAKSEKLSAAEAEKARAAHIEKDKA